MTRPLTFDHAIIVVSDLSLAIENFTHLGFTVTPGGELDGGSVQNALITFADGTYLELFALKNRLLESFLKVLKRFGALRLFTFKQSPIARRFIEHIATGEGLADFVLSSESVDQDILMLHERRLLLEGPLPGGRLRPDGQRLAWKFGVPQTVELPFLIEDVTPRSLRIYEGSTQEHKNGVRGVVGIAVAVKNLAKSAKRYRALLDIEPEGISKFPVPDAHTLDFRLGSTTITLVEPINKRHALNTYVAASDGRPWTLRLRTASGANTGILDTVRTSSAEIEMLME